MRRRLEAVAWRLAMTAILGTAVATCWAVSVYRWRPAASSWPPAADPVPIRPGEYRGPSAAEMIDDARRHGEAMPLDVIE